MTTKEQQRPLTATTGALVTTNFNPPVVGVASNPMLGLRNCDMRYAEPGATLAELAPETKDLLVCRLNSQSKYVPRELWHTYRVQPNDIVIWEVYPQGRDLLRSVLQIIVIVIAIYTGYYWIAAVGLTAINLLLPPILPTQQDTKTDSVYTTSLAGNQAKLYDPIPKVCGRHKYAPPFAAQPYFEFDANGDQYYYAMFAIGVGQHEIEQELIDDTQLDHFSDVTARRYLPAGKLPTVVLANVATAPEVSGLDLKTGVYVGGFAASAPKKFATHIGIDIIAPRGLGHQDDDGGMSDLSVNFSVEYKQVDDFGTALSEWTTLATETKTAASTKQQRWSFKYALPSQMRVEIRVGRIDERSDSGRDSHDITWFALRAYLAAGAPLNPYTAHYEVVLRASEQLSQLAQRSVNFIIKSFARKWSPYGSPQWTGYVHTRNPAWWLLDLATDPIWGLGLSDDRIDLMSFYELSLVWEQRQDRFDFIFETTMDAWEAMQLIARAGRARVFRRNGLVSIARDGFDDLPVTAFTPRNTTPGSMLMQETLPTFEEPDGVILEYFNNRTWTWIPIECPCPGVNYGGSPTQMKNPVRMRLPGITGSIHAQREGVYEAARMLFRRRHTQCITELQGMLPAFMSTVRWMPEIPGYGVSGDVIGWYEGGAISDPTLPDNPGRITLQLSEPVDVKSDSYITLVRDNGTLTTPVGVSAGATLNEVVLGGLPDFEMVLDDPNRELPKFLFGTLNESDELIKILSISDGGSSEEGGQLIKIEGIVDDPRVHEADVFLLPTGSPTPVQDAVDYVASVNDSTGGTTSLNVPQFTGRSIIINSVHLLVGWESVTFKNNGTVVNAYGYTEDPAYPGVTNVYNFDYYGTAKEWLRTNPVDPSEAALFEIRAATIPGYSVEYGMFIQPAEFTGVLDTWVPLDVDREWKLLVPDQGFDFNANTKRASLYLRIELRKIGSSVVQASNIITFDINSDPTTFDGGGGGE